MEGLKRADGVTQLQQTQSVNSHPHRAASPSETGQKCIILHPLSIRHLRGVLHIVSHVENLHM